MSGLGGLPHSCKFAAPTSVRAGSPLRPSGVRCWRANREDLACS